MYFSLFKKPFNKILKWYPSCVCCSSIHLCASITRYINYSVVLWLTSSVLVAEVREPPHVAQADSKTDAGHDEVHLPGPGFSFHLWYSYSPISRPSGCPVLGLWWATAPALTTPWADSRHRHKRVSWPALLLGHHPCLQLREANLT